MAGLEAVSSACNYVLCCTLKFFSVPGSAVITFPDVVTNALIGLDGGFVC